MSVVVVALIAVPGSGNASAHVDLTTGRSEASRQFLASPPFPPTDRSLFTPQVYGAPATPPAAVPQTEDRVRAQVTRTLVQRFGGDPRRLLSAVRVIDEPRLKAKVADIRLRGAVALLAGTDAQTAIDVYRSETFARVAFGPVPNDAAVAISTTEAGGNRRSILVNQLYQNEDIRLISATLSHEALHQDNFGGQREETVAHAVDSVIYAQSVIEDPTLVQQRTELSRRLNTRLLALVNTRDRQGFVRLTASPGNVYPESNTPLRSFAEAFDYLGGSDSPGSPYLDQTIAAITGQGGRRSFDLVTIDLLDRRIDNAFTGQEWVRVVLALRLRPTATPTPPLAGPATAGVGVALK